MDNWKNNLKNLMGNFGHHPIEKWNDNLCKSCIQWVKTIKEGKGLSAKLHAGYEDGNKLFQITVQRNGLSVSDFICRIQYRIDDSGAVSLMFKAVSDCNYAGYMLANAEDDKEKFYHWTIDEVSGIEIFEEGYILETVTIAFSRYLDFINGPNP